ncbi:MAG: alpha/beta hydrolase: peptidase or carbohydrate esterase [Planctomycetaceae bacterium]|nr:alpha/beta hydrolase: peptidase or carbohydrate esterase [Planctomycetaceae bacterium]
MAKRFWNRIVSLVLSITVPLFCASTLVLGTGSHAAGQSAAPQPLTQEQRATLEGELKSLEATLKSVAEQSKRSIVDAAIFAKGINWALSYDKEFSAADIALFKKAMVRGAERATQIKANESPWSTRRGKLALGYISQIDQSVQPYGLIVPKGYDQTRPTRLDVVLHGSTRPVGLSELRFMARFDEGDAVNPAPPDLPFIELHPLGRVENCYRWAGETDVFEAIEDVCRRYNIDRDRIVLRGMSMGASGTWHLGLKHPDRFVALGPYCGYVDTHRFSETPLPNFVKIGQLPEHQELALHMLDSVDYAANAGVVPTIACMGEKDIFFDAHVIMGQAFQKEGLKLVNLISPGTGHVIDPVTHAEQMRQIASYVEKGLNRKPSALRFVTWTLKYSRCDWLQILGLEKHYARAEFFAALKGDALEIAEPLNITRFAIQTAQLPHLPRVFRIGDTELKLPDSLNAQSPLVVVERRDNQWHLAADASSGKMSITGKRPGLQGPIDDAFTTPFLCVRGTGTAWNPAVQTYCDASLKRFENEWRHYFRGDLPIKDDTAVTEEDLRTRNLILFGDPGSNTWIAKALPQLPVTWTRESIRMAGHDYPSAQHVPAFIAPNPLPGAPEHYIVINSGHTFREAELAKVNYLLFPRWGDWAVLKIDPTRPENAPVSEEVLQAGYFNEQWKLP